MSGLKVGDSVRWETDVDKVYSHDTKMLVGTVGKVLPPQEYYDSPNPPANKYLTPDGYFDIQFLYEKTYIVVGQIPESELVKVEK